MPIVLSLIAVLAFVVRVAYVLVQSATNLLDVSFVANDSLFYLELGRNIAAGQGMTIDGAPTAFVGPGYPLFVAALLKLSLDPLKMGVVQAVLGSLTPVLIGLIAADLAPAARRTVWAAVAAMGAATYPHLIFWTGYVLTETLFVFLVVASLFATLLALRYRSPPVSALAGILGAAAALTRPPFLAVLAVLLVWTLLRERALAKPRWSLPVVFLLAAAVPMSAWAVRNWVELGAPIVTSTESGHVFYQGNSRDSNGGSRGYVDARDYRALDLPPGLTEVQADAAYLRAALDDILADPLRTVARWPAKLWNMWRPTYEGASLRNGTVTIVTYVPLLLLGTVGAVALLRRGTLSLGALPLLVLAVWVLVHVMVTGMIRFRLPAEAVLLTTLPAGVDAIRARWAHLPR